MKQSTVPHTREARRPDTKKRRRVAAFCALTCSRSRRRGMVRPLKRARVVMFVLLTWHCSVSRLLQIMLLAYHGTRVSNKHQQVRCRASPGSAGAACLSPWPHTLLLGTHPVC